MGGGGVRLVVAGGWGGGGQQSWVGVGKAGGRGGVAANNGRGYK